MPHSRINSLFLIFLIWCHSLFGGTIKEAHRGVTESCRAQQQALTLAELIAQSPPNLQVVIYEGFRSICGKSLSIDTLHLSPLNGGFSSSKLFIFSVNEKQYVLRVLDPKRLDDPMPTRDKRMREVLAHQAMSELGIAPEVAYSDSDGLILIMSYINSHTLASSDLDDENFLLLLGSSLHRLHQTKIQLPEKRTQLDRAVKHYIQAKAKGIAFPSNFACLFEEYINEGRYLADPEVLCHGDLNPANILVHAGCPLFIDWAGATYDHPFTDIGYLTMLSGMTPKQTAIFLKGYFGRDSTADEFKRVEIAQARTCFLTAVVWFDFSETLEELLKPMQGRVDRLDQLLASPTLKTGYEYILERKIVNPAAAPAAEIQKFALGFLKEYLLRMEKLEVR